MGWVERRVEQLRVALDVEGEIDGSALERLAEYVWPEVEIRTDPARFGICIHKPCGQALVIAGDLEEALHEIGHALLTNGLGAYLEMRGHPAAEYVVQTEEAIIERWLFAWGNDPRKDEPA